MKLFAVTGIGERETARQDEKVKQYTVNKNSAVGCSAGDGQREATCVTVNWY